MLETTTFKRVSVHEGSSITTVLWVIKLRVSLNLLFSLTQGCLSDAHSHTTSIPVPIKTPDTVWMSEFVLRTPFECSERLSSAGKQTLAALGRSSRFTGSRCDSTETFLCGLLLDYWTVVNVNWGKHEWTSELWCLNRWRFKGQVNESELKIISIIR